MLYRKVSAYLYEETNSLIIWTPVVFAVGCLVYFQLPYEPSLLLGIIPLICGFILVCLIRRFFSKYLGLYQISWSVTLIALGFCLSWIQTHRQEPFYQVPSHATIIQGKIKSIEYLSSGKIRLMLGNMRFMMPPESDQQEWNRYVYFTLSKKDVQTLNNGEIVQARVLLHRPNAPQFVGGYDLQFRSWFHNIGAYGYALEPVKIIKSQPERSLQYLREIIASKIRKIDAGSSGTVAQILLTGIGGELSPSTRHAYSASGLAHLLAIAGLHLGIIMGIVAYSMRWLLLRSEVLTLYLPIKTIAIVIGWSIGCVYLVLTGLHIPALRSLLMASIVMLALLLNRPVISIYNLMLAAIFLLLFSPNYSMDVSFQMSMAAVMSLISGYHLINRFIVRGKKYQHKPYHTLKIYLLEAAWVSVLAGTSVVPIVVFYFHELNLYFVFANLIAVPLMAFFIMPLGLLSLCAMPFGLEVIFLKPMLLGISAVTWLAELVSNLPYASISIPLFPTWGFALYFIGLCILCLCITPLRWVGVCIVGIGLFSMVTVSTPTILTSSEGRMIGIRNKHKILMVCQGGCNPLTLDAWKKLWGINKVQIVSANQSGEGYRCYEDYCLIPDYRIIIILNPVQSRDIDTNECNAKVLELSFLWGGSICKNIPSINKKTNWIEGAHSI